METDRYSRQIRFRPIGSAGQSALSTKHAVLIGAGALGSTIAETLTRAGIGTLTLIDRDYVEYSNLQRQFLYSEKDARMRMPKAIAAHNRLKEINSEVTIHAHVLDASSRELDTLIHGTDLLLDATDNFDTRLILNDLALKQQIPWIYGACIGGSGMSFTFLPGVTPCLHCLLSTGLVAGETCDLGGIIAPAVQMVAAHQSAEALKLLTGNKASLRTSFLTFDLWRNQHHEMDVSGMRNPVCPSCGSRPAYPFLAASNRMKAAVLCGRDTVQLRLAGSLPLTLDQLAATLSRLEGKLERNPYLVSYSFGDKRMVFFPDGRILVHGTDNLTEAKRLYHSIMG